MVLEVPTHCVLDMVLIVPKLLEGSILKTFKLIITLKKTIQKHKVSLNLSQRVCQSVYSIFDLRKVNQIWNTNKCLISGTEGVQTS